MIGYVQIHRDIMDWEWYQCPKVSRLWIHLILKVNFKDKKWQGNLVKRGQLITSQNHLAVELGLSVQTVRTGLQKLKDSGCIEQSATSRFTRITLVNYDKYQSANAFSNKPNNKPITSNQQTNNNQLTTTKESNKRNKGKTKKLEERRSNFKTEVLTHSQYESKILKGFFNYWSELNSSKTNMRFESEKYFEIANRLKKWHKNEFREASPRNSEKGLMTNR